MVYRRTQLNKKCDYLYTETNNKQKKNDEAKSKNNNTMIRTKSTCIKLRTYSNLHKLKSINTQLD